MRYYVVQEKDLRRISKRERKRRAFAYKQGYKIVTPEEIPFVDSTVIWIDEYDGLKR